MIEETHCSNRVKWNKDQEIEKQLKLNRGKCQQAIRNKRRKITKQKRWVIWLFQLLRKMKTAEEGAMAYRQQDRGRTRA